MAARLSWGLWGLEARGGGAASGGAQILVQGLGGGFGVQVQVVQGKVQQGRGQVLGSEAVQGQVVARGGLPGLQKKQKCPEALEGLGRSQEQPR